MRQLDVLTPVVLDYVKAVVQSKSLQWLVEMGPDLGWLLLFLIPVMVYASRMIDRGIFEYESAK